MNAAQTQTTAYKDSKKHYEILDALRGVAAIMVVCFHVLEIFSNGDHSKQIINHGYLAVDFFFLLSGFVIGYAYDDRWKTMTLKDFFKRRLIRLHPMIIMGMTIGAVLFYFGASPVLFPQISQTPFWKLLVVMLIGYTLLPVPASLDIRGWNEMHPLNGPAWSLFFEYVGNILYALFIRKISTTLLSILVLIAAGALIHLAITSTQGDLIGGWSLDPKEFRIGLTRLLYPFLAGLLLNRICKPGYIKNAFSICSVLIIIVLAFPRVGSNEHLWMNGLYDSLSVILMFPLIVFIGASGEIKGRYFLPVCRFLGNISYPLYIIHYPLIYVFSAWVVDDKVPSSKGLPVGLLLVATAIVIAYACLKWYDVPVRKWLAKKYLEKRKI